MEIHHVVITIVIDFFIFNFLTISNRYDTVIFVAKRIRITCTMKMSNRHLKDLFTTANVHNNIFVTEYCLKRYKF